MTLREYLEQRENELLTEIEVLQDRLAPKLAELTEIRRAKEAIGMEPGRDTPISLMETHHAAGPSPYETMTMKELAIRVLKDQYPHGATLREMLDHIRDTWGRDIDRNNFSPQLSRMYQEGTLGRIASTKGWFLIEPERRISGFRPYRVRHTGALVWDQPETVAQNPAYEPLLTHEIALVETVVSGSFNDAGITTRPIGGRKQYRLRQDARHGERQFPKGTIVWLGPEDAVEPWHEPIDELDPGEG